MATSLFIATSGPFSAKAQEAAYKWDAGVRVGMAGYLGDYSSNVFSSPGFQGAITGRYLYDTRWSFSGNIDFSYLNGSVKNISGDYPGTIGENFSAITTEINFRAEFNFFPYGIGETYKGLKKWSPYLAVGAGVIIAKPKGGDTAFAPEIPMAFGIRYKLNKRFNLIAEISLTKTFTDGIDNAGDIYGIKSEWFKNTDWTSSLTVGFTYEFGERCATCHYVD